MIRKLLPRSLFWGVILASFLVFSFRIDSVAAALTASDALSDVRPGQESNHTLTWSVNDTGGIDRGESFRLSFAHDFDIVAITSSDIAFWDDDIELAIGGACDGSAVAFANGGDSSIVLTVCLDAPAPIASGSIVRVEIGTQVTGATYRITNPDTAGGYDIGITGQDGYADTETLDVMISPGIVVAANVVQTGEMILAGWSSPSATLFFYEEGAIIGTTVADSAGYFTKTLTNLDIGLHTTSIVNKDSQNIDGTMIAVVLNVAAGSTTYYGNLITPPTFALPSDTVARPAALAVSGQSRPQSNIEILVSSVAGRHAIITTSDANGRWQADLNPVLHLGNYTATAMARSSDIASIVSRDVDFTVTMSADLDSSGAVDDNDLAIFVVHWANTGNIAADINDDNVVDVRDFGIMMFEWQG